MIEILKANSSHSAMMAEIHAISAEDPWTAHTIEGLLENPSVSGLLALWDGTPAGFILFQAAADEAEILNIATRPLMRRKGIAKSMIVSVSEQFGKVGAKSLFLEVAEDNHGAQVLYRGLGFVEVGRRARYYQRAVGACDALIFRFNLVERGSQTN